MSTSSAVALPSPSLPSMPEGFTLHGGPGYYYWTRGELVGPRGVWGSAGNFCRTPEEAVANAAEYHAANPLTVAVPERTPEVLAAIAELLSSRKVSPATMRVLQAHLLDQRYSLRFAVASSGLGCGPGCARQALYSLGVLGRHTLAADVLAKVWRDAHEVVDPYGWWIDPRELRAEARDRLGYSASETWRRATIEAFDAVRARPMETDLQASAWSPVAARYYALHLLGVKVTEVSDLKATVRGWLPARFRA